MHMKTKCEIWTKKNCPDCELNDNTFINLYRKMFAFFLNNLPVSLRSLIIKKDKVASKIYENRTSHAALELVYNKAKGVKNTNTFFKLLSNKIWMQTNNSRAVRNRLKIVKKILEDNILRLVKRDQREELKILSIASGSARAIIESIHRLHQSGDLKSVKLEVLFLDKSERALKYSNNLVKEFGLNKVSNINFSWQQGNATAFVKELNAKGMLFDIVEMVGLLDYFDDRKVTEIFREIHKILNKNAYFITANIVPNFEQKFMTKFVDWKMIYRSCEDMLKLAELSGFKQTQAMLEPLKIHVILNIQNHD